LFDLVAAAVVGEVTQDETVMGVGKVVGGVEKWGAVWLGGGDATGYFDFVLELANDGGGKGCGF
jgi:hypothetical protein